MEEVDNNSEETQHCSVRECSICHAYLKKSTSTNFTRSKYHAFETWVRVNYFFNVLQTSLLLECNGMKRGEPTDDRYFRMDW